MRRSRTLFPALAAVALLRGPTSLHADDTPRREILASGDVVAGLGRIGWFAAEVRGMDQAGRLLVTADLSDGSNELFWASERGLEPLHLAALARDDALRLQPNFAVTSPAGVIALTGAPPGEESGAGSAVLLLGGTPSTPLARIGSVVDGFRLTYLYPVGVTDDGVVALGVFLVPTEAASDGHASGGTAIVDAQGIHLVAAAASGFPAERRFDSVEPIGITRAGDVVFYAAIGDPPLGGVYAGDAGGVRALVQDGDSAPSGQPLARVHPVANSATGDVLFSACEGVPPGTDPPRAACGVYRTERGRIVKVAGGEDRTPDGFRFAVQGGSLNAAGDAVLHAAWLDDSPGDVDGWLYDGLLLYAAGATTPTLIAAPAAGGALNERRDVAVVSGPLQRWRQGRLTTLVAPGAVTPSGAVMAVEGLPDASSQEICFADDGRVGVFAGFVDGTNALLCADADGVHVIVRDGNPVLQGGTFWPRPQCAFADDGQMLIGVRGAVFRADATGIERVMGTGDPLPGGDEPLGPWLGEFETDQIFAANRRGTVVAVSEEQTVARRRPGGPLEVLPLDLVDDDEGVSSVLEVAIADDDSVLATVDLWSDNEYLGPATTVIHLRDDGGHVIARQGPPRHRLDAHVLNGTPKYLWARGALGLFADETDFYDSRQILYDLRSGALQRLLDIRDAPQWSIVYDVTPSGVALLDTYVWNASIGNYDYGEFLFADGAFTHLSSRNERSDTGVDPVALGAPGAVLYREFTRRRQSLSVSGPVATGHCPAGVVIAPTPTATPPAAHGNDGCQIDRSASGHRALAPFAGALLLFGLRRCRHRG